MKLGLVTQSNAVVLNGVAAVCGIVASSVPVPSTAASGKTTRYWDCCKPSCSWSGKAKVTTPVRTCQKDGISILTDINARNGCESGGTSFTCSNNSPFVISTQMAYGFAAANVKGQGEGDWCCTCYKLTFTSTIIAGKQMIVQVTNSGADLGENHFDLQIPGGGVGIFNGCSSQWGAPTDGWGQRYGGVSNINDCTLLPPPLQNGCRFRFQWFQSADNPTMTFEKVTCPVELTNISGCKRL